MGSVQDQNPWPPSNYIYKDCSQGICSVYCPQWCYMIFPPPPVDDYTTSGVDFSPVIIAVIGILATALILVSCYTIVSKYRRRQRINGADNATYAEQILDNESRQSAGGLDESIIKLITVFKYKKNEGFVDNTDCSVCLSEFQENESLRVLPLCSHAFHIFCIDIWLKSHANCPLCRANILPPQPPPTPPEESPAGSTTRVAMVQDLERVVEEDSEVVSVPKPEGQEIIRRSLSLNSCSVYRNQVSIADILRTDEDDDDEDGVIDLENNRVRVIDNISHRFGAISGNDRSEALGMRRSISTGRFKFTS